QQIHPMPFYIMDEIDAHLDVLNAKRLATLVKSKSTDSQFVVISLKDTTISRADRVFGVYIDQGQSQVISLPNNSGVKDGPRNRILTGSRAHTPYSLTCSTCTV